MHEREEEKKQKAEEDKRKDIVYGKLEGGEDRGKEEVEEEIREDMLQKEAKKRHLKKSKGVGENDSCVSFHLKTCSCEETPTFLCFVRFCLILFIFYVKELKRKQTPRTIIQYISQA